MQISHRADTCAVCVVCHRRDYQRLLEMAALFIGLNKIFWRMLPNSDNNLRLFVYTK